MRRTRMGIVAFAFLALSCIRPNSDAELRSKIIGTWRSSESPRPGLTVKSTVSLNADKSLVATTTISEPSAYRRPVESHETRTSGNWTIKNSVLIERSTNTSNHKIAPVGYTSQQRILKVDEYQLVLESEDGRVVTWERQ